MELKDTIEGMISDDYIERFKAEYNQVVIRSKRLGEVIRKAEENKLEFELSSKLKQLNKQLCIMCEYITILEDRAKTEGINLD